MSDNALETKIQSIIKDINWSQSMFNRFSHSSLDLKENEHNHEIIIEITDKWMQAYVEWDKDIAIAAQNFLAAILITIRKEFIKSCVIKVNEEDKINFFSWWKPLHDIGALDAEAQSYNMSDEEICLQYCENELIYQKIIQENKELSFDLENFKELFKKAWIMNQEATENDKVDVNDEVYLQYMITLQNSSAFDFIFMTYIKSKFKIKLVFKDFNKGDTPEHTKELENFLINLVENSFSQK